MSNETEFDSAEIQIERKCDSLIRELDEICALAVNSETYDLIERQRFAIGQMLIRIELVAGFINSRKLKVVSNG